MKGRDKTTKKRKINKSKRRKEKSKR